MTNQIALFLGVLIVIGLGTDFIVYDGSGALFVARKLTHLIEWLKFWR